MHCLHKNLEQVVALLIEYDADINAVAEDGKTPLALALDREDAQLATILRSYGALYIEG